MLLPDIRQMKPDIRQMKPDIWQMKPDIRRDTGYKKGRISGATLNARNPTNSDCVEKVILD